MTKVEILFESTKLMKILIAAASTTFFKQRLRNRLQTSKMEMNEVCAETFLNTFNLRNEGKLCD